MEQENNLKLEIRGTESYEAVISSEFAVKRDGVDEVLIHTDGSIDLSRFPLPLLVNHNMNNQIGSVENPRIEDGSLIADIRFTNDDLGKLYEEDVIDKIRNNLSIGYKILESIIVNGVREVTDFLIYEASIVPVPADPTAKFRKYDLEQTNKLTYRNMNMEEDKKLSRSERSQTTNKETEVRDEIISMRALGKLHNKSDMADDFIENGNSLNQFRSALLDAIQSPVLELNRAPAFISQRREEYSVSKAILGMDDASKRGFEWEVSKDLERSHGKSNPNAVIIDMTRTMNSGTAGQNTIETAVSNSIQDFMQQKSVVGQLGCTNFSNNVGDLRIPVGTSGSGATVIATDGSTQVGEATPVLANRLLSPSRFGTVIPLSFGFIQQSTPDVEGYVRRLIANTFAGTMDAQVIAGSGSGGNVQGLIGTSGVLVESNGGTEVTFSNFMDAISKLGDASADISNLKMLIHPSNINTLVTAVKYASTDSPILDMSSEADGRIGTFMGYPVYATSAVTVNNYLLGDFRELAIANWGGLELSKNEFYDTRRFISSINGIMSFDSAAIQPTAFCKITKA